MPLPRWQDAWWSSTQVLQRELWRAVEAQHIIATMKLADTVADQDLLEQMLEASKPALPAGAQGHHYLLTTPFRYRSPYPSRFRTPSEPGVWYGAETLRTACVETAYWRWRFIVDSDGLRGQEVITEHTLFAATVCGRAIDLASSPWAEMRGSWTDAVDYSACHQVARAAREHEVQWIRYSSARDTEGHCGAVFEPGCLTLESLTRQQTWICQASQFRAILRPKGEGGEPFEFGFVVA